MAAIFVASPAKLFAGEPGDSSALIERCGIEEERNRTGNALVYGETITKKAKVDKTVKRLKQVTYLTGHKFESPRIEFQNDNSFGISSLVLGFGKHGAISKCSDAPSDYLRVVVCQSALTGMGVGSGEYGVLDCDRAAKPFFGHDFCIIGFSPNFDLISGGLAQSINGRDKCE